MSHIITLIALILALYCSFVIYDTHRTIRRELDTLRSITESISDLDLLLRELLQHLRDDIKSCFSDTERTGSTLLGIAKSVKDAYQKSKELRSES